MIVLTRSAPCAIIEINQKYHILDELVMKGGFREGFRSH